MAKGILVTLAKREDGGRVLKTMDIAALLQLVSQGKATRRNATLFYENPPEKDKYTTRTLNAKVKLEQGKPRGKRKANADTAA